MEPDDVTTSDEWTPVGDALPGREVRVNVVLDFYGEQETIVCVAQLRDSSCGLEWQHDDRGGEPAEEAGVTRVTHWRPLPAPPEEEKPAPPPQPRYYVVLHCEHCGERQHWQMVSGGDLLNRCPCGIEYTVSARQTR